jgi:hypothetical protein
VTAEGMGEGEASFAVTARDRNKQARPKRPWQLVELAFVGAGICALAIPWIRDRVLPLEVWQVTGAAVLVAVVAVVVVIARSRQRSVGAALGVAHFWRYPPLWVAGGASASKPKRFRGA